MPSIVEWYLEDHVLHVQVFGIVTVDDVNKTDFEILSYFDEQTNDSAFIHILLDTAQITEDVGIKEWIKLKSPRHERCGWVVEYGTPDKTMAFVGTIAAKIIGIHYKQVATLQDALDFLSKYVPVLNEHPKNLP